MLVWIWLLCPNTLSIRVEYIAGFYDLKRKNTIWIGSSEIGGHNVLMNKHAEELAFEKIKFYIVKNNFKFSYNKNIYIYIFKYKFDGIKDVYCCKWCTGLIKRNKFPEQNLLTMKDNKMIRAINPDYEYVEPLKHKKFKNKVSKKKLNL